MPIYYEQVINSIEETKFHTIDYQVMKDAFNLHNECGRFANEILYKKELAKRCFQAGFEVRSEFPITLDFMGFVKIYRIDLLINNSVIFELKATNGICDLDRIQTINYILFANLNHAKIINFGTPSIETEFVSSSLNYKERLKCNFRIINKNKILSKVSEIVIAIVSDIGGFLGLEVYKEILFFLLGGKNKLLQYIDIIIDGKVICQQKFYTLDNITAIHISAIRENYENYKKHIYKLIRHTRLKDIVWVNFNKRDIFIERICQ